MGRTPLVLARSSDNGKTWKGHLVLEDAPNHGYAYTAMLFDRGKLFLAYCCGGLDTCECMLQDMKIRSLSAEECGRTFVKGNAEADLQCIREHLTGAKKEPWTWLFYGDSITHGAAHTCGWRSFPEIFGERVRWELRLTWDVVINTAISGNSTAELTNPLQYEWLVRCRKPNVVMVLIGTNDIIKLDDIDLFRENLTRLVRWIRIDGAIPILQTYGTIQKIPENRNYVKRLQEMPAYNDAIRKTAAAEDVILIDHDLVWQKEAADPDVLAAWLGEPIHPGAKGHLEYGKEIFRKLDIFDPKCGCCNPVGVPFSIPPRP
ncbi:MAG: hypothetical protein GX564_04015 [Oligosphaeraceae bacterium]|nr:hypothetical protein [Oligosphaeraceae bacterium]